MAGTEYADGMLITHAGVCLPVKLEVERYGRRPIVVTAHDPVPNGQYKLLCGSWIATIISRDGQLDIADALAEFRMSAEQRKQFKRDQTACITASRKKKARR